MTQPDLLLLLNLVLIFPITIITSVLVYILKSMREVERRLTHIEAAQK